MKTEPTTTTTITYLGVTAPLQVWEILGYHTANYRRDGEALEVGRTYTHFDSEATQSRDSLVLAGIAATGKSDQSVIGWALTEQVRRAEEKSRVTALAREAEAIGALAAALREAGEKTALENIIGRLSERTQFAVRAQLKRA